MIGDVSRFFAFLSIILTFNDVLPSVSARIVSERYQFYLGMSITVNNRQLWSELGRF